LTETNPPIARPRQDAEAELHIVWEFHVAPAQRAEFLRVYGAGGEWTRLFERAAGFRGTRLLGDRRDPERYVTIDRWDSEAAFGAFRERYADEYEVLDRRCEVLVESETLWGRFTACDESGAAGAPPDGAQAVPFTCTSSTRFERRRGDFLVTTDATRFDIEAIHAVLAASYWATGIPRALVERGIRGSLAFGLFEGERQIGFARAVTDGATYAYLADVYVETDRRGQGLGTWLVQCVLEHPDLQGLRRWSLATRDAHAVYEKLGFRPLAAPERMMEIVRPAAQLYGAGDAMP
jgi:GNAT superfamily N-acetyltransferase